VGNYWLRRERYENALKALEVSTCGYVLEVGRIVLQGSGRDLLHNPAVQAAYLGVRQQTEVILEEESRAH
jgi:branched-chain amino acid transport system ATP-binding protein